MFTIRLLHLSLFVLLILAAPVAQAADPSLEWRTITTPHFYIHYYKSDRHDEADIARRVARAAEAAHRRLAPTLRHVPSIRTHIVLTDDTDGANGSAQIVPMNIIRLFATGPSSLSSLNDYDDWFYGLIMHEYTHILHIDTIHGVARIVNAVLGKTWAPNQIQPRWFVEGLAVYYESERTSGGRNRSAVYDMYLRMAVLEGKLLEMDHITSNTRYYPRGTVPYLYGSRFIKYIADRYGEDKLTEISHAYGGTVIPYSINRVAHRVLGKTYIELYDDFKEHLRRRYALQKELAARRGLTPFSRVTDYGESCGSPRFSADGRELVWIDTDGRSYSAFKIMDVATGRVTERYDVDGGSGVGFTPDGRQLVYGRTNIWKTYYHYHDIYVRDRESGRERQLTSGLRARDPAVSPDGRRVVFTTNDLGSMGLAVIPFEGGKHEVLYRGRDGDQIFAPRWSPDGRYLTYSHWRRGGERDIVVMEVASRTAQRITADRALDTDPMFSSDGKRIYFTSDRTGIFNIYCYDLERKELSQVSNLLGGAFVPAISPDEKRAYYVGFSAKGYDLHEMKLDRAAYKPALPYINTRPEPDLPTVARPPSTAKKQASLAGVPGVEETYKDAPYSPLPTIYPRAWSFSLGTDVFGTRIGLELVGGDVVGRHRYAAVGSVSTEKGQPSYSVAYSYTRFWPSLRLDTSRFEGARGGVLIDGEKQTYIEENYGFGLGVGLPVLRVPRHSGDISLGYRVNWFRDADETTVLVAPGDLSPRLPEVGLLAGFTVGLGYRSVERYAHSISNERGRFISLSLRVDHPSLGSDFESVQLTYAWTEYIDIPWFNDHVVALRLGGGVAGGNLSRRGIFFIGGFPEQDLLRSFFDSTRVGGVFLRGYPPGVVHGDQYHLLNFEYRMPLYNIERGVLSLPLYFTHVHLAGFVDYGNAFFGDPELDEFKVGVGAEVLLEMVVGYYLPTTFRFGYARGLMDGGGNEFHFLFGNPF
jgi:hypothetical protein